MGMEFSSDELAQIITNDGGTRHSSLPQSRPVTLPTQRTTVAKMAYSSSANWIPLSMVGEDGQDGREKGKELIRHPYPPHSAFNTRQLAHNSPHHLATPHSERKQGESSNHDEYRVQPPEERIRDGVGQSGIKTGYDKRDQVSKLTDKKIDGILTPDSGDVTVHLELDLQEDIEGQIEELVRRSRLGQFTAAKEFFQENFQDSSNNPYVLVLYADLLLQQGDFRGVTCLDGRPIFDLAKKLPDSRELQLLRLNWELMQLSAKSRTLEAVGDTSTLFDDVTHVLSSLAEYGSPIGSTEIKIVGLALQLIGTPAYNARQLRQDGILNALIRIVSKHLYQTLLRQGRIWDFHDLLTPIPTMRILNSILYGIFRTDLITSLQTLISDWSAPSHEQDSSTTLALLSILTYFVLEPIHTRLEHRVEIVKLCQPLARSILDRDPTNMRTRPYLRFLLANSQFTEIGSQNAVMSLAHRLLNLSPGICFHADPSCLPIYIPKETEKPNWVLTETASEAKESAQLVLRTARSFGDIRTEALSLTELIRLSANPRTEFDELYELQQLGGDLFGSGQTLPSRYLIANTTSDKETLRKDIAGVLSHVTTAGLGDPNWTWATRMLMYKLEGRSSDSILYLLNEYFADYHNMKASVLQQVLRKMPELSNWALRQLVYTNEHRREEPILQAQVNNSNTNKVQRGGSTASQISQATIRPRSRQRSDSKSSENSSGSMPNSNSQFPQHNEQTAYELDPSVELQERDLIKERLKHRFIMKPDTIGSQIRGGINMDSDTDESEESGDHEKRQRELEALVEKQKKKAEKYTRRIAHLRGERVKLLAAGRKHKMDTKQIAERMREAHDQLEQEKQARQEAERERDEKKSQLGIFQAATTETLAQAMVLRETQQEAMRKAMTDIMYEHERQAETTRRREVEERDKIVAETRLEGERRINAVFRAMAAERERMLAIRNQEEWILAKASQANREEKMSLLVAQKLVETAQAAGGLGSKSQDNIADQEALSQAERQELRRRLELESRAKAEAESLNSQDESRKQQQEESREEIRKWAADEAQRQANSTSFLHFTDALGRKFVFPFESCRAWAGMEDLIKQVFSYDDVIGPHVQAGHYNLMLDDAIILPQLWEFSVEPGSQVMMHMWPTTPTEVTNSELRSSQGSSDFNVEHSIPEVQDSNDESPSRVSSRIGSSDSGLYHTQDHIPPPVPEAPLSPYEGPPTPAWHTQSVSPASSLYNISRVGSEEPRPDESIFEQSRQGDNVSTYSIEGETASQGSQVGGPRSRRRFRGHLSTWRWRRFRVGVAKTVTSGPGSGVSGSRSSNETVEGEKAR